MPVSDWVEKIGRAVFESPFAAGASGDTPELAEIRLALLDQVKAQSQLVAGRHVFPFDSLQVLIRGVRESEAEVLTSPFLCRLLEDELRASLRGLRYRFPEDLTVEIVTTPALPQGEQGWLSVESSLRARPPEQKTPQPARLVVLRGVANESELPLHKTRTNIGRTVDVVRTDGPSRRNDLAFTDDNEINRTVSREHAHILYLRRSREYRLFNDRIYNAKRQPGPNCGLWIIRDGLSQAVHRDGRGARLKTGDEIHLGSAVVRFEEV
jgi:hypothetical protein